MDHTAVRMTVRGITDTEGMRNDIERDLDRLAARSCFGIIQGPEALQLKQLLLERAEAFAEFDAVRVAKDYCTEKDFKNIEEKFRERIADLDSKIATKAEFHLQFFPDIGAR